MLNELRDEIYETAKEKGWYANGTEKSFGEFIALCHSELSEALEVYRDGIAEDKVWYVHTVPGTDQETASPYTYLEWHWIHSKGRWEVAGPCSEPIFGNTLDNSSRVSTIGKPEGISIELADVIIRILDYCGHKGIDIEEAVYEKNVYNKTRSHRHGNKVI